MDRRDFLGMAGVGALLTTGAASAAAGQPSRWRPDGVGERARVGVLTPDFDPVPESEMWAMAPVGVSIHGSRVPRSRTPAGFAESSHIDGAVERLVELAPRAIALAYTSSSYALGADSDAGVRTRLNARAGGIPIVLSALAATEALRALTVTRLALVHPPWFNDAIVAKGREYFRARGFDVVHCDRIAPARSFTEVRPDEVYDWVAAKMPSTAEAVLIAGNGLRAIGAIEALEATLGRPVLTANQVAFWAALRAAGVKATITGYGRVFQVDARA